MSARKAGRSSKATRDPTDRGPQHLFGFAPLIFVLLDPAGLILDINAEAGPRLRSTRKRLLGMPFRRWVVEDSRRQFVDHLRRARSAGGAVESPMVLRTRSGDATVKLYTRRTVAARRTVYPTVVLDLSEFASLAREKRRAEEERDAAEREGERARAADAAKDHLIALVSHELRNPLTPARTAAAVLAGLVDVPPLVRQLADVIARNIDVEARLIDDLLDLSRVGRGQLQMSFVLTDVHAVIEEAVEASATPAIARGVTIALDLGATRHHTWADPLRLRQVFWNLLQNAVKFSNRDGVVTIRTSCDLDQMIRIRVSDRGAGMDATALALLFKPFVLRARPHDGRNGLGVGLTICKGIVDSHGGRMTAISAGPGQGATFEVALATAEGPLTPAAPKTHRAR